MFDPGIPQSLENVVRHATAKDPSDRYKTANEMAEDLYTSLSASRLNEPAWEPTALLGETKVLTPIPEDIAEPEETTPVEVPEDIADDILAEQPPKKTVKIVDWLSNCGIKAIGGLPLQCRVVKTLKFLMLQMKRKRTLHKRYKVPG